MKKLSLLLIILLVGFPQLSETIYTPALPNLTSSLNTTPTLAELTLSIYFIGFALGVFFWGFLSDSYGRRPMMLLGIALYTGATFLCATSHSVQALLLWRLLQAFGASCGSVITQTMMRDVFEGKERNQIFSLVAGALAFAPAIGPFLGGFLSDSYGWASNFYILLIMGLAIFIYSWIRLPETRPPHTEKANFGQIRKLAAHMLSDKNLLMHVALIGACNGIIFGFYGEAPFVYMNILKISPKMYGFLGLLIASASIVSSAISHCLNEFLKPLEIIKYGILTTIMGAALITGMTLSGWISFGAASSTIGFYSASFWMIFFGIGLIISNSLSIALKDYSGKTGSAGSLFGLLYYVLISLFTGLMGFLHTGTAHTMSLVFLCLTVGMLVALMWSPGTEVCEGSSA